MGGYYVIVLISRIEVFHVHAFYLLSSYIHKQTDSYKERLTFVFIIIVADVVTEFIEGLVETYPGLQFLDGFPEVVIFVLFCFYFLYFSCIEPYL